MDGVECDYTLCGIALFNTYSCGIGTAHYWHISDGMSLGQVWIGYTSPAADAEELAFDPRNTQSHSPSLRLEGVPSLPSLISTSVDEAEGDA